MMVALPSFNYCSPFFPLGSFLFLFSVVGYIFSITTEEGKGGEMQGRREREKFNRESWFSNFPAPGERERETTRAALLRDRCHTRGRSIRDEHFLLHPEHEEIKFNRNLHRELASENSVVRVSQNKKEKGEKTWLIREIIVAAVKRCIVCALYNTRIYTYKDKRITRWHVLMMPGHRRPFFAQSGCTAKGEIGVDTGTGVEAALRRQFGSVPVVNFNYKNNRTKTFLAPNPKRLRVHPTSLINELRRNCELRICHWDRAPGDPAILPALKAKSFASY